MILDPTNSVLLPIDVQQGFDLPGWPARWNAQMETNGRALLAHWRAKGGPIIHVRHDSVAPGSTLKPGQPGNDFRKGFEPLLDIDGQQNGIGWIQDHRDLLSQGCLPVPFAAFIRQ